MSIYAPHHYSFLRYFQNNIILVIVDTVYIMVMGGLFLLHRSNKFKTFEKFLDMRVRKMLKKTSCLIPKNMVRFLQDAGIVPCLWVFLVKFFLRKHL